MSGYLKIVGSSGILVSSQTKGEMMSTNYNNYCAIKQGLKSRYPIELKGNNERQLNTLSLIIAGIVFSQKTSIPAIVRKVPDKTILASRIRKIERWLDNRRITSEIYYLPFLIALLNRLPDLLMMIIDGSNIGRNCAVLSINVVYKKRALPLCWLVVSGGKGHFSEASHIELAKMLAEILPKERKVVFLGDGEFDGVELLETLSGFGWYYVCRTAVNVVLWEEGERFSPKDLFLEPGEPIEFLDVQMTKAKYGPVLVSIIWEEPWTSPLILISNLDLLEEAWYFYRYRFRIETFFSDQKSRGFYLCHSHLSNPEHLSRLFMACCLAYLWMVFLGDMVKQSGWVHHIHRRGRCDLSLFQIGLRWIDYCLNENKPLIETFWVDI